jgi:hypothetical protein
MAVLGTSALGAAFSASAHTLAGTPHIRATIAPSLCLGFLFNAVYARALFVAATRAPAPACA